MKALVLVAALLISACSDGPTSPRDRLEAARAQAMWATRRPQAYTYEVRVSCFFCVPGLGVWTEVRVSGDRVVSVIPLGPPLENMPPVEMEHWPTVNHLFEVLQSAFEDEHLDDIDATYDPHLGYPRQVRLRCPPDYLDCGTTYEARNLKPLP